MYDYLNPLLEKDKLSKAYAQVLKWEVDTKVDSHAPIRKIEDVILEYLDCGGTIESGSTFGFAVYLIISNINFATAGGKIQKYINF